MPRCPVCNHDNPKDALFCARCTSPVKVTPLHELTEEDRRHCLQALFEVLSKTQTPPSQPTPDNDLWPAYLRAFWLRPETAVILYAEALAIRALAQHNGPWLDLGCGDAIHTALYSGWRFEEEFDAFQSVDLNAPDIYNHFNPQEFSVQITARGNAIAHGIDIKPTAIARAKSLNIFQNLQQADATNLPLPDNSIAAIFSNMLRDLGDPLPQALKECYRILKPQGQLLLSTMTPAYAKHLYFAPKARQAAQTGNTEEAQNLLKLDRGRSIFCQRQLTTEQWQTLLQPAGLTLQKSHTIVGEKLIPFWDTGLRPFTHDLLKMRQSWQEQNLLQPIKHSLLKALNHLLTPLLQNLTSGTPCMQLLDIRKQ
jgi:SAM-dependent methyltransferase